MHGCLMAQDGTWCNVHTRVGLEVTSGQRGLQLWLSNHARDLSNILVVSQSHCEAWDGCLVPVELKRCALAAQKITSGLHKEASVPVCARQTDSGSNPDVVIFKLIKKQRQWANNTDTLMWLCDCAMTHTAGHVRLLTNYTITENPVANSLHFHLIYRVLASFLWLIFFF